MITKTAIGYSSHGRDQQPLHYFDRLRTGLLELVSTAHAQEPEDVLLPRLVEIIAACLAVDCVEILEHEPAQRRFVHRARFILDRTASARNDPPDELQQAVPEHLGSQAGYTLLRNRPVILDDNEKEERFDTWDGHVKLGVRSGITVPVVTEQATSGVLGAYCRAPRSYVDEEVYFLTECSRYLAGALSRYRDTRCRFEAERRLRVVEEAALCASSTLDEQHTLQRFAQSFSSPEKGLADVCFIEVDTSRNTVCRSAAAAATYPGLSSDDLKLPLFIREHGSLTEAANLLPSVQPVLVTETNSDRLKVLARNEEDLDMLNGLVPLSYMYVPIKLSRRNLGALVLLRSASYYSADDVRLATCLATIVGRTVEGVRARLGSFDAVRDWAGFCIPAPEPPLQSPSPDGVLAPDAARGDPLQHHLVHGLTVQEDGDKQLGQGVAMLTPRLRETLHLLATGRDTTEIAKGMGVTNDTIYKYINRLRKMFGVDNRGFLIAEARRLGYHKTLE